jgi:hypothetical protein
MAQKNPTDKYPSMTAGGLSPSQPAARESSMIPVPSQIVPAVSTRTLAGTAGFHFSSKDFALAIRHPVSVPEDGRVCIGSFT